MRSITLSKKLRCGLNNTFKQIKIFVNSNDGVFYENFGHFSTRQTNTELSNQVWCNVVGVVTATSVV